MPDAHRDARFRDSPLVVGAPHVGFYAGAPLLLSDGARVGTLCVIDHQARRLTHVQRELLRRLSQAAAGQLEGRRAVQTLQGALEAESRANALIEYSADAVLSVGPDRLIRGWNPAATGLFGFEAVEVLGQSLCMLTREQFVAEGEFPSESTGSR